jgi:hypothetical protein
LRLPETRRYFSTELDRRFAACRSRWKKVHRPALARTSLLQRVHGAPIWRIRTSEMHGLTPGSPKKPNAHRAAPSIAQRIANVKPILIHPL